MLVLSVLSQMMFTLSSKSSVCKSKGTNSFHVCIDLCLCTYTFFFSDYRSLSLSLRQKDLLPPPLHPKQTHSLSLLFVLCLPCCGFTEDSLQIVFSRSKFIPTFQKFQNFSRFSKTTLPLVAFLRLKKFSVDVQFIQTNLSVTYGI